MAELGAGAAPGMRAPSLLGVALALSLALNLCAGAGYLYSQWRGAQQPGAAPEHRPALDLLSDRLNLRPDQQQSLDEFRRAVRKAQGALLQQNRPLMEQAWGELDRPTIDGEQVEQLLDEMALHRHAFQVDSTAALIHFLRDLTPEQRQAFAKIVLDHKDPAGGPIRNSMGN